jgi:hypothetical protein
MKTITLTCIECDHEVNREKELTEWFADMGVEVVFVD